ncbi:MAG: NADH-quinone oxidoreductase subunit C [Intrasporangiaceae bacterium]|nr:NADH-quinone oxidoreductase subunit C [Intrasporangiaceae bacterium]
MAEDLTRTVARDQWRAQVEAALAEGFTFVDWLTAVDRTYEDEPALEIVTRLLRIEPGDVQGVRLTTRVPVGESIESLTPVRPGFAFHERETCEMFGQDFEGFTDDTGLGLRPLLLPDGFEGTPLRKDFQLAARASKTWPGGKEPGEGHDSMKSPSRRRVQAPGVPPPEWGPR